MGTLHAYCMHVCVDAWHGKYRGNWQKGASEDRTQAARLSSKHMYFQSHISDPIMGI